MINDTTHRKMENQNILINTASQLLEAFKIERQKPDTSYQVGAEYHTNIFNAIGDAIEDVERLIQG